MRWPVQYCCYVLEMHIFSNTHLEGLYTPTGRHRTCMSATTQTVKFTMYTLLFCQNIKPQDFFFLFWERKKGKKNIIKKNKRRRLKRAYSARETLYQKWEGAGHQHESIKQWVIVLVQREWRLLQKAALYGKVVQRAAATSSKPQSSCDKKRGVSLLLCYAQVLPRWVNSR